MKMEVGRFYVACLWRAFAGWFKRVEGWTTSVSLLLGVGLLVAHASPKIQNDATVLPSYFFIGAALAFGSFRLILAPYSLYREQLVAKEEVQRAREPKLEISLPDPPVISSISLRGGTSETLGGTRQTITSGWEMDVVALLCRNMGESAAKGCRARLMSVTRMTDHGAVDVGVVESVDLPWKKEDPEGSHVVDIPAFDTRRVWIGGVRTHGHIWLFRSPKSLPIADSDDVATLFRTDAARDSDMIPPVFGRSE